MTDFEKLVEMFDRANIKYYASEDNTYIGCGTGEGMEFYFDKSGKLIGGC